MRVGGGVNHRATLSDQALVKDNHVLAAGGVVPAYRAVRRRFPDVPVQVEVTTLAGVAKATRASTGCGGCAGEVRAILERHRSSARNTGDENPKSASPTMSA